MSALGAAQREGRQLLGRDRECSTLASLVAGAQAECAGSILLRGVAGIGKTALLDHAVTTAEGSGTGMRIVRLAGIETEIEMPYAGLHRLLRSFQDEADQLPSPQRAALDAAFGTVSGEPPVASSSASPPSPC